MAGGMDRRTRLPASLVERTSQPTSPVRAGPPQRHCWVRDPTTPNSPAAGLLVEWRQLSGAWQGRVAYVITADGETTLVEAWLPAEQLQRAGA